MDDLAGFRRRTLRSFLMARRAALRPEPLGLPRRRRRRTPGLNRGEVAALAGISTPWYERIETQRGGGASDAVLGRIADVLRLDETERSYLHLLAADRIPELPATPVSDFWFSFAAPLAANVVFDAGFQRLRSDELHDRLFDYGAERGGLADNALYKMFASPARRELYPNWRRSARHMVGKVRWMAALTGSVPPVVETLLALPEFAALWDAHPVAMPYVVLDTALRHPNVGDLRLRLVAPPVEAGYFAGSYIPRDEESARRAAALLRRSVA